MTAAPRLTAADRQQLERRHAEVVAAVLKAERRAHIALTKPVEDATRRLVEQVAGARDEQTAKRLLYSGVRTISQSLAPAFAVAVSDVRDDVRAIAQAQAALDLGQMRQQAASLFGAAPGPEHIPDIVHTVEQDATIAYQAGASMANRWSSFALGSYGSWRRAGEDPAELAVRVRGIHDLAEPYVRRHTIAQTLDAYADEHRAVWTNLAKSIPGAPHPENDNADSFGGAEGWGSGIFHVWSAVLDRKTCARCGTLDGEMVRVGEEFPDVVRPPLHVHCRCVPIVIFVPEAAAKKLPGIALDYSALKADVLDYVASASLADLGKRHAAAFIREGLAGQSPVVLTRRFAHRRDYLERNQPRAPKLKAL